MSERQPDLDRLQQLDELLLRQGIDLSDIEERGFHRINYWQQGIKNADGEHEAHDLMGVELRPTITPDGWQAAAARITPSRANPPKRDYRVIAAFSDAQIDYRRIINPRTQEQHLEPIHDEKAMRAARLFFKFMQPDVLVDCGDMVDYAGLSNHPDKNDHFFKTVAPSLQRYHDYLAELRADHPNSEIHVVDSNHNLRLRKQVLRYLPALYDVYQAGSDDEDYPVLTTPHLANFKPLDINYHAGYGAAEYVYGEEYDRPPIVFKHGQIVRSNGSTAAAESKKNPETHVVRGHGHRTERHTRTDRNGNYLTSIQIGALCLRKGQVEGYHSSVDDRNQPVEHQEDWQASVLVIEDYDGNYNFTVHDIIDGIIRYKGREFDGN